MLDVMPTGEDVLGFGNRWYHLAVRTAESVRLPSGRLIRLIAPPVFPGNEARSISRTRRR